MRSVELFAGAGGLGMGISRAGFEPVAVIEWNRHCCHTLRQNQAKRLEPVAHWPLVEGDVRDFDFSAIRGGVDLVSGGPPCQPFSLGGKHRGCLDERDMFPQAIRAVRELQPKAFMFENVKGLTRANFIPYLEYIRLRLSYPEMTPKPGEDWTTHRARLEKHHSGGKHDGLYYHILTRGLLNAANYGIPQRRERIFLVGFRADLGIEWSFPEPTHDLDALLWSQWHSGEYWERHRIAQRHRPEGGKAKARALTLAEEPRSLPWRTVRDAIADLPDPEIQPTAAAAYANHRFQPGARSYPGHTGSPLDEPAKTLKAGDHGVPGGENMLLRPDGSVRYFTVRESARLQTFPDDFRFEGSWTESMRQIGNAVPVELAAIVAGSIKAHLAQAATPDRA
ncbi:DNA (cytosine-5)-methyltransferase 1 [Methylomagnum ishizawai]|uniref:DNA (cytosine-5-)-methyltransferase n=1 Tax=Methylomagnum ishizawai TaxID=1760988 RepID=A0A1Y6CZB0_9GAMM|nr:DNA cytosine methyltransferase [Methylomagnum ishizawai]SMF93504.1 DNA (cytosine-5)-methyltransferase 1 [Methylomagnum ishizawai]